MFTRRLISCGSTPWATSSRSIFASMRSSLSFDCEDPHRNSTASPDRLPDQLQELRLPVLEGGGQELGPEVRPAEALPMLLRLVAHRDCLCDGLPVQANANMTPVTYGESVGLGDAGLPAELLALDEWAVLVPLMSHPSDRSLPPYPLRPYPRRGVLLRRARRARVVPAHLAKAPWLARPARRRARLGAQGSSRRRVRALRTALHGCVAPGAAGSGHPCQR